MRFTIFATTTKHGIRKVKCEWIRDIQAQNISPKFVAKNSDDFLSRANIDTNSVFYFPENVKDIEALEDNSNVFQLNIFQLQNFINTFEQGKQRYEN